MLAIAMIMTGCSTGETTSSESTEVAGDFGQLKIGLVLPGTINDQGWSQTAYAAVVRAEEELGAEVSCSESVQATDYDTIFRTYADQGYNVVIGHGNQFFDSMAAVAVDYPNVQFIVTSTDNYQSPNLASLMFGTSDAGFLGGAVQAILSESNKIGIIGGEEISSIQEWAEAAQRGALYVNPDIDISVVYTGSMDDAMKSKEAAFALIEKGVDVISQNGNNGADGAILACNEKEVINIGVVSDKSSMGDSVLTSSVQDVTTGIFALIQDVQENGMQGENITNGVDVGAVYLTEFSGMFADQVTDEQKAEIQDVIDKMVSGEITSAE